MYNVFLTDDRRLAPEDPFPAAVHDSWEAVLWVAQGSGKDKLSIDTSKLATGGSSAGGNLAAIMCQRAVDRPELGISFRAQLLSVPVTDNTADPETKLSICCCVRVEASCHKS